ncbi:unnamed protein product [Triticum turgidum subsp. durum]|uniref:Uncharacterized protein n=1 Tax=Triticum turgidum subsp. durum TaxID=4567 RepID=A0A9R0YI04_TRITD|nr:unnamed protein product [Triticum turgidum subsp. durum]
MMLIDLLCMHVLQVAAKKLRTRLSQLGAKSIMVIGLGDDQDSSGYEKALGPWLLSFWKSLNRTNPSLLPRIQARPRCVRAHQRLYHKHSEKRGFP